MPECTGVPGGSELLSFFVSGAPLLSIDPVLHLEAGRLRCVGGVGWTWWVDEEVGTAAAAVYPFRQLRAFFNNNNKTTTVQRDLPL